MSDMHGKIMSCSRTRLARPRNSQVVEFAISGCAVLRFCCRACSHQLHNQTSYDSGPHCKCGSTCHHCLSCRFETHRVGIAVGCRSMACHARFGTHSAWQQPPREATRALCYSWLLDAFTSECQDDLVGLREGRVLALTSTLVSVPCSPCFCA